MLRAARRKEKRRSFNLSSRHPSRERRRLHAGDWYKRRIYIASLSTIRLPAEETLCPLRLIKLFLEYKGSDLRRDSNIQLHLEMNIDEYS